MQKNHQAGIIELKSSIGRKSEDAGEVGTQTTHVTQPTQTPSVSGTTADKDIIFIEQKSFIRECVGCGLEKSFPGRIASFASLTDWLQASDQYAAKVILLGVFGRPVDVQLDEMLEANSRTANQLPFILLCDSDDPARIVTSLKKGAKGYIPTSICLDVVAQALQLVLAGGVFVPANSLIAARQSEKLPAGSETMNGLFTARQAAVVEKLRIGKANKTIAYELNMCESTVKVHVRNIMKKLRAKNRTEVAFIANRLSSSISEVRPDLNQWSPKPS